MIDAKPMPKEWSLDQLIESIKSAAPAVLDSADIRELRRRARNRKPPELPDLDSLQAALGRIVEAIRGKPIGVQTVRHHKTGRFGVKQYAAHVAVRDVLAVGLFLESKGAHDNRTQTLYDGALGAKWGEDHTPHYVQQLVGELFHMLQVAAKAGA